MSLKTNLEAFIIEFIHLRENCNNNIMHNKQTNKQRQNKTTPTTWKMTASLTLI